MCTNVSVPASFIDFTFPRISVSLMLSSLWVMLSINGGDLVSYYKEIHSKGLAQAFEFAAVESRNVGEGNCGSSFRDFLSAKDFKLDA